MQQCSDEDMATPEMQFFMLVLVPCLLEFGKIPSRLYANARRGDLQSLVDLIRLDKTVAGDPAIAKWIHQPTMERDEVAAKLIGDAFSDGVQYDPSPGQIKAQQAALLIALSEGLGCKLKPVEVRHLFDAIQKDLTGDDAATDTDLPEYNEGWRQAIYNGKKRWHHDLARNKNKPDPRYAYFFNGIVVSAHDATETAPTWLAAELQRPIAQQRGFRARLFKRWLRARVWFKQLREEGERELERQRQRRSKPQ
jgi:hypothetical protein